MQAKAQAAANLLANTTSELEQLKLQRQELAAKLEQAEAKIDAASKASTDWKQLWMCSVQSMAQLHVMQSIKHT